MIAEYVRNDQAPIAQDLFDQQLINAREKPDEVTFVNSLSACGLHSSFEHGELVAKEIDKLGHAHPASYSTLSKIHSERGVWNSVQEFRKTMEEKGIRKQNAGSWVEFLHGMR
ncbi:hypothetical protein ACFX15_046443 [Malus domestica]